MQQTPFDSNRQKMYEGDPNQMDSEFVSTRGEAWSDLLSCLTTPLLRVGLLLQLLVLIFASALYYGHGGKGVFTFDIFSMVEDVRSNESFITILIILEAIYLIGCLCISSFQIYVADNSKVSRGFRAGSKLLSTATQLDTFVVGLRLVQYVYAYEFLGERWWMKYTQSSTDWCLYYNSTLIHSLVLILYGLAVFYLEAYHDEGTYEEWGWIILGLFGLAGTFEFFSVVIGFGNFFGIIHIMALAAALIWAFSFEPLLHYYSPIFHDRNINTEIAEKEAEYQQQMVS